MLGTRPAVVVLLLLAVAAAGQASSFPSDTKGLLEPVADEAQAGLDEARAAIHAVKAEAGAASDDAASEADAAATRADETAEQATLEADATARGAHEDSKQGVREAEATAGDGVDTAAAQVPTALGILDQALIPVRDGVDQLSGDLREALEPAPEETPAETEAGIVAVEAPSAPAIVALAFVAAAATAAGTVVAFWVAGSSGTAAASGSAAAKAGTDLRRLLPFASPLFTRFERDTVLGHPKREALYALILQEPGVSLQALCEATGLSRTAVTHHLRLLELQHLVVSKRKGRSRHYFENGGRFGREQKDAYAALQNPRSKEVARFIQDHAGAIQKDLCAGLGLQPSVAHWHVRRLKEAGLVEELREGRTVKYYPGPALKMVAAPVVPAAALEPTAAEPVPAPVMAPRAPLLASLPMA